jgi:hypothetical protein
MAAAPPQNPQNNTSETNGDVFSMTDDGLARRFQFQNEVTGPPTRYSPLTLFKSIKARCRELGVSILTGQRALMD